MFNIASKQNFVIYYLKLKRKHLNCNNVTNKLMYLVPILFGDRVGVAFNTTIF